MDYAKQIGETVAAHRKRLSLSQEALAGKLGISYQAVSKWENGQSCPDITLLPELAALFGISLDELFGKPAKAGETGPSALPWPDDGVVRIVVFQGAVLQKELPPSCKDVQVTLSGEPANILCHLNLHCDNVAGNIKAGGSVTCEQVGGSVSAGGGVTCDSVGGPVSAGGGVTCDTVSGPVSAGGSVSCDTVHGPVSAGSSVTCDRVEGDVRAQTVKCDTIEGRVFNR